MAEHHSTGTAHAYVLVTADPTKTEAVAERLRTIPGARVHEVMGPYDMVVELEAEAIEYISQILRNSIRPVPGVTSTVTCTWME